MKFIIERNEVEREILDSTQRMGEIPRKSYSLLHDVPRFMKISTAIATRIIS